MADIFPSSTKIVSRITDSSGMNPLLDILPYAGNARASGKISMASPKE